MGAVKVYLSEHRGKEMGSVTFAANFPRVQTAA